MKRLVKPGMGFVAFESAWKTLQGYESMSMMRKGQMSGVANGDIQVRSPSSPASLEWQPKLSKKEALHARCVPC